MKIIGNVNIEPQAVGLTSLFQPHPDKTSSMRSDMNAKALSSSQVISGAEFPHLYTGFEQIFGDYTHGMATRQNDVKILETIPRYDMKLGAIGIDDNPSKTVIFRDLETGELGYFEISRYTQLSSGFGYFNQIHPFNLSHGTVLRKEDELVSSPSKKDGLYCMGVNANTVYISREDTTEDAIPISRSLANKLSPLSIETVSIVFDFRKFPLNINGDDNEYKIIPNLGDKVGADGILAAFRKTAEFSVLADLTKDKLNTPEMLYDELIYTIPEGIVIDIDVKANRLPSSLGLPVGVYDQVYQYHTQLLAYYQKIYDVYTEYRGKGLIPSDRLNTLVTKAMGELMSAGVKFPGFKKTPSRLVHKGGKDFNLIVTVTIAKQQTVEKGFKLSDNYGNKGVIDVIIEDEDMPVDENGFRADMVIDPATVQKRTNVAQLRMQYINRASKWVAMNLANLSSTEERFATILDYVGYINPVHVEILKEAYTTPRQIERYVKLCMEDTIHVYHPPSCNADTDENLETIQKRFNIPISPVTFATYDRAGNRKLVTTTTPALIGSKYIYLLHKYPKPIAAGFGYINKLHIVSKNKFKLNTPISSTHCRFGEAEHRMFIVAGCGDIIARMRCLYGNSLQGPSAAISTLLNARKPSRVSKIAIDEEVLRDNEASIRGANNMIRTIGVELQNVLITPREAESHFAVLRKLDEDIGG